MLGAGGEQLAVYNGVQVKFKEQNETYVEDERFVYMYLHSFISAGGQLVTLADGTKQFNIVDNLGSVRCIVSWDGTAVSTQAFDYKPFGDLQEAGEENRIGYFGEQRDKESDYFAMGFRLYDPEIGRFLAIDPLLDVQPSQTPYHYCFNNPTSFTDPTGLYPEKEKDKVQTQVSFYWVLEETLQMIMNSRIKDIEEWQMSRRFWRDLFHLVCDKNYNDRMYGNGGGGGGSSSGRTGTNVSGNGVDNLNLSYKNTDDQSLKDNVSKCLNVIKLLANLLSTIEQVVKNLNNADANVYFFSSYSENNKEHYKSEFGNKDLTEDWNKHNAAALITSWDNDKMDLCLSIEFFSAYSENYTPFILLDELMHHAYDNLGINTIIEGVITVEEIQHMIFYEAMYKELNFDKPGMIIINTDINYHFRSHIEELYNRHKLK